MDGYYKGHLRVFIAFFWEVIEKYIANLLALLAYCFRYRKLSYLEFSTAAMYGSNPGASSFGPWDGEMDSGNFSLFLHMRCDKVVFGMR